MFLSNERLDQAIDQIRDSSNEIAFQRRLILSPNALVGIAEGDSWFDYLPAWAEDPVKGDLINQLNRFKEENKRKFNILRIAEAGDTLENMVLGNDLDKRGRPRRNQFIRTLELVRQYEPDFILFSGGGNDVVGEGLDAFINHAEFENGLHGGSGNRLEILREEYVDYMLNQVFKNIFEYLIGELTGAKSDIQILLHGYGNAIPDGKPVIGTPAFDFIGPWMEPTFARKRIDFSKGQDIIIELIKQFNEMLKGVASNYPNVHYLDLRHIIQAGDWANELHLTVKGYEKVAQQYIEKLQQLFT
ncbi:MAG: hypothetical protein F6K19_35370 [Cyanothece sp. SIO1E1]|nr:hypothetical protein [Cyanothece sp. SIO1E1]